MFWLYRLPPAYEMIRQSYLFGSGVTHQPKRHPRKPQGRLDEHARQFFFYYVSLYSPSRMLVADTPQRVYDAGFQVEARQVAARQATLHTRDTLPALPT